MLSLKAVHRRFPLIQCGFLRFLRFLFCEHAIKRIELRQLSWILAPGVFTNVLVFKLFIRSRALLPFLTDFHLVLSK